MIFIKAIEFFNKNPTHKAMNLDMCQIVHNEVNRVKG